jgi:hypothetical protein
LTSSANFGSVTARSRARERHAAGGRFADDSFAGAGGRDGPLDATLVLITLVTSTALVPITAPLFAYAFIGTALTLSPLGLGLKLLSILAGSLLVAGALRCSAGASAINRHRDAISGLNLSPQLLQPVVRSLSVRGAKPAPLEP